MKQFLSTPVVIMVLLIFAGCKKSNDDTAGDKLPGKIDLKNVTLSPDKKSFQAAGITFTGANGYIDRAWENCVSPDGAEIRVKHGSYDGIELSSLNFNTLIADVSRLPAIHKVTVAFFNNCCPNLSACDGNDVIATTTDVSNGGENATITLNIGGKKAGSISFQSLEAIVHSITIE